MDTGRPRAFCYAKEAYRATVADVANRIQRTQSILNAGAGEVVTGISAWNTAMHDAVQKMVKNGLTGFIDHAGRKWSPEAYAAMDIRTTMFNTARAAVWERAEGYGADLYQVSSHNGARPLCYPWQGKVISRSDWSGEVEDMDGNKVHVYAQSETSYGEAAGLFGVNCRHYPMTFIPGFSVIRGEPQDPEENAEAYALSQEQRGLERKLREEKRDLAVMQAQGAGEDEIRAQRERVNRASAQIEDFCDENGLPRRRNRESAPVNATFPQEGSYDPTIFSTETRDRMREWFGGATSSQQASAFNSIEDFDKEIENLRAKRAKLFEVDDYDKAETDRLLREIQSMEDRRSDWAQANTLAGGDTRLTNMLRSDDPVQVVGAVDEILDDPELGLPKSHWNGEARVRSVDEMDGAAGYAYFSDDTSTGAHDGSIDLRVDYLHEYSTAFHEDIHQRSRGDLSTTDLGICMRDHKPLEEGTVQLMTEEVCKRIGYEARRTYPESVNALREFHAIFEPKMSDYDFAKRMLDRSPFSRYNYVMDSIQTYEEKHPRMRSTLRERLNVIKKTFEKGADAK